MVIKKTKNVIKSITYREISFKLNVLCQVLKEVVCKASSAQINIHPKVIRRTKTTKVLSLVDILFQPHVIFFGVILKSFSLSIPGSLTDNCWTVRTES